MKKYTDFEFNVEETSSGYRIEIDGDKEKLKSKVKAVEALLKFKQKEDKSKESKAHSEGHICHMRNSENKF